MFDFFTDTARELAGVDVDAKKKEKKEKEIRKKEEQREERVIIPVPLKKYIYIFGALWVLCALISLSFSSSLTNIVFVFLSLGTDIAGMICAALGTKETETASLILIGLFFTIMCLRTIL